jgi:uncharacterized membrane protein YphA (DoxX/SURF4 family)
LAYIHRRGVGKIGVTLASRTNAGPQVDRRLLPLAILTELGGLLVLFEFKTRWAAIALFVFLLADGRILPWVRRTRYSTAMAGFLALALLGHGAWSLDG